MLRRFPTLSRTFVIIEFRDMLIKSARSSGAVASPHCNPGGLSLGYSTGSPCSPVSPRDRCYSCAAAVAAAARSLHIALTTAYETSIHRPPARPLSASDRRDARLVDGRSKPLSNELVRDRVKRPVAGTRLVFGTLARISSNTNLNYPTCCPGFLYLEYLNLNCHK